MVQDHTMIYLTSLVYPSETTFPQTSFKWTMKEIEDEGLPKQFGYASRLEVRLLLCHRIWTMSDTLHSL